jgi:hypothetical protein
MTDNQRFWGFSKTRLKSMLASELQDEGVRADLESTRNRTLKARLIRTTDATGQVVDFKNSVVGPVVDHSYVAPSADELLNRTRTVTGKALRGYEEDAEDGDGDGKIQDSTPYERPAPTGSVSNRKKKPKRKKRQERTSKPKRRRLIDSLRNIGKRREGESAQDRASRVPVNAIEGGRGPEEFPEEDGQNPDEVMAELEQIFNDMWGEENEESPDDVLREIEEMFDDVDQQMREERAQADRDSEERAIERQNRREEEMRDIEPLPFEKDIPEDGLSPANISDELQRGAARSMLWDAQLSGTDIEDLASLSNDRVVEEILSLRKRAQKLIDQAKNPDRTGEIRINLGDDDSALDGIKWLDLDPKTVKTVQYGTGYYFRQIADYLEDRLVAREGSENVPIEEDMDQPNFDDPDSQKLWEELSSQIEQDAMKKDRIGEKPFDLAEQEDGGLLLGTLRFGDIAETEEDFDEEDARSLALLDKFGGKEKYGLDGEPEDLYIDLDDPNPDLLDPEYPEKDSVYYSERTTPSRLPTMDDMPEELRGYEYWWEMYLEDQEELLEEIEPGRYFRLESFPYWFAKQVDEDRKKENTSRLINHIHDRRFVLKDAEKDPKKFTQDIMVTKDKFQGIFDRQARPEGNPDFGAVLSIAIAYKTYMEQVSNAIVFDKNKARKQIVPLTMEQFIEVVAARGLGGTGFGEDFPLRPRE